MDYINAYKKRKTITATVQEGGFLSIESYVSDILPDTTISNISDWITEWEAKHPEAVGRKVKVTIELVPTDAEFKQAEEDRIYDEEHS